MRDLAVELVENGVHFGLERERKVFHGGELRRSGGLWRRSGGGKRRGRGGCWVRRRRFNESWRFERSGGTRI